MIDEQYVDGVLAAGLNRGMLRIDLYSVSPGSKPGSLEEKLPRQRLVMTPAGFAEIYGVFTGIMQKLQQAGLVGAPGLKADAQPESAEPSASGEPADSGGLSPNF